MYIYIAFLPYYCYYRDLSFTNLLIADIDSLSNLDNSVYNILAPTPAKPVKITPARSKRTTSSNAGRYTTNSSLIANKDDNNAYNRAYIPPANIEEEEGGSDNNNGINSGTSNSTNKGKGSSAHKRDKGTLYYKDTPLRKQQRVVSYPCSPPSIPYTDIYVYYI
ncbi:hypothetical protein P8C59_009572 [Phyllachora maydis]|uniref:Uncharacterized protein n=1 Tax=Phyllachora maydis TaxID=1825666 RepID=A0AAD9IE71_9PEZI|nr:hypothetical protein P8C59_009572 [Phyllachora maydis]